MATILIFVRQKQTLLFLAEHGGWAAHFAEARRFRSTWEAVDFCMKKDVHRAEVVMRFGAELYDVRIDVL